MVVSRSIASLQPKRWKAFPNPECFLRLIGFVVSFQVSTGGMHPAYKPQSPRKRVYKSACFQDNSSPCVFFPTIDWSNRYSMLACIFHRVRISQHHFLLSLAGQIISQQKQGHQNIYVPITSKALFTRNCDVYLMWYGLTCGEPLVLTHPEFACTWVLYHGTVRAASMTFGALIKSSRVSKSGATRMGFFTPDRRNAADEKSDNLFGDRVLELWDHIKTPVRVWCL